MILVDTCIWSDHFRQDSRPLRALLAQGTVLGHPWVLGELLLGSGLPGPLAEHLASLPQAHTATQADMLKFVQTSRLRGVGWVDAQLLLSAIHSGAMLWTRDAMLRKAAHRFGVAGSGV